MTKSRTAEASLRVYPPDSAEAMRLSPEDSFPAVSKTFQLIEIMELAAARALHPELRDGQTSVALETRIKGTDVFFVSENRSVPFIRAVATRTHVHGRVHHFTVNVFDESGLIATAGHARAVVIARRLEGLARRRAGRPSMQLNF